MKIEKKDLLDFPYINTLEKANYEIKFLQESIDFLNESIRVIRRERDAKYLILCSLKFLKRKGVYERRRNKFAN